MAIYSSLKTGLRKGTFKALSDFFTNEQTAPIVFSHRNGAEPAESYVVINVVAIEQIGLGYKSTLTNELEELTLQGSYEVRVQFSFCGSESQEMASTFTQRIGNNPVIHEEFSRYGLGYMRKSSIRRAPQKRETEWVEYQNIDVTFSYTVSTQQVVDVIEAVVLEDVTTGDTSVIPPETVIIP